VQLSDVAVTNGSETVCVAAGDAPAEEARLVRERCVMLADFFDVMLHAISQSHRLSIVGVAPPLSAAAGARGAKEPIIVYVVPVQHVLKGAERGLADAAAAQLEARAASALQRVVHVRWPPSPFYELPLRSAEATPLVVSPDRRGDGLTTISQRIAGVGATWHGALQALGTGRGIGLGALVRASFELGREGTYDAFSRFVAPTAWAEALGKMHSIVSSGGFDGNSIAATLQQIHPFRVHEVPVRDKLVRLVEAQRADLQLLPGATRTDAHDLTAASEVSRALTMLSEELQGERPTSPEGKRLVVRARGRYTRCLVDPGRNAGAGVFARQLVDCVARGAAGMADGEAVAVLRVGAVLSDAAQQGVARGAIGDASVLDATAALRDGALETSLDALPTTVSRNPFTEATNEAEARARRLAAAVACCAAARGFTPPEEAGRVLREHSRVMGAPAPPEVLPPTLRRLAEGSGGWEAAVQLATRELRGRRATLSRDLAQVLVDLAPEDLPVSVACRRALNSFPATSEDDEAAAARAQVDPVPDDALADWLCV
jgi:hypothetical protein